MQTASTDVQTTDLPSGEDIAHTMSQQGKYSEAEALLRSVLSERARTRDARHPDVIRAKNNLAASLKNQNKAGDTWT